MKIIFFINDLGPGGAERAVSGLANHWIGEHEIEIITFVKMTPFYNLHPKVILKYCFEQPKIHSSFVNSIKDGVLRFKKLHTHLKLTKPDVVLSFMHTANIYSIWACKWLKIPCIISERANHAIDQLPTTHEIIRNLSYPYSSRLVVQTKGNLEYYSKILTKRKISVIPNAIASDFKTKRNKANNNNNSKVILNVGSFKSGKAQDVLIRAFSLLLEHDWLIVFLGKGPNLEKFKALAKELGVDNRVTFTGAQKDVASYYNNADMFVFTSEHEGFPNALLEALYFGLPSISTDCPHGPADMITNGENGYLVPVGDVNALAEKIDKLMNDIPLRKSFSYKAIESTKKYEMERIAEQWMELILKVIRN